MVVTEPVLDHVPVERGAEIVNERVAVVHVLDVWGLDSLYLVECDTEPLMDGLAVAVFLEPATDGSDSPIVGALAAEHAGGPAVIASGKCRN